MNITTSLPTSNKSDLALGPTPLRGARIHPGANSNRDMRRSWGEQFLALDTKLRSLNGNIIHQVWFGTIPNKLAAKKAYKKLAIYRNSWIEKNPDWFRMEWNKAFSTMLIRKFYPEYLKMFISYRYEIQRCDMVRYAILHRYGGWYVDMDYYCNKSLTLAREKFPASLYLVQSPNGVITQDSDHISNSLMFSIPEHPFWRTVLLELHENQTKPYYYSQHLTVMMSTGPGLLNRVYSLNKVKYGLKSLPWKLFHPYGIKDDKLQLKLNDEIYAVHGGKGSWEKHDSKLLLFLLQYWALVLCIITILAIPIIIPYLRYKFVHARV
jgi:mannosyltransferase OCH1-like enzyme